MAYIRNQPVAADDLDVSQPNLVVNTNGSDDSFGVNHYKFSDTTANNGKHNTVQTPIIVGAVHPTTAANEPQFYAMQDYPAIGVLQYSRGGSDAVPSAVTYLQSPASAIPITSLGTINVLNFTGIASALCVVYIQDVSSSAQSPVAQVVSWNGSAFTFKVLGTLGTLQVGSSGNIVIITNASGGTVNVKWSVQFLRIQ